MNDTQITDAGGSDTLSEVSVEGDSFTDIQNAIDTAESGDTVYLNSKTYTGSGSQITVNKSLTIDGSSGNSDSKAIINANDSSRIFYVNGKYDLIFKNIIFEHAKINAKGSVILQTSGDLSLINCEFRNMNYTVGSIDGGLVSRGADCSSVLENVKIYNLSVTATNYIDGIFMYSGIRSKVIMNDIEFYDNILSCTAARNSACEGGILCLNKNSQASVKRLNAHNIKFNMKNQLYGSLFNIMDNSKFNLTDSAYLNSHIESSSNSIVGGLALLNSGCEFMGENITFTNNNISSGKHMIGGLIWCDVNCKLDINKLFYEKNCYYAAQVTNGALFRMGKNSLMNASDIVLTGNSFNSTGNFYGGFVDFIGNNVFKYRNLTVSNTSFFSPLHFTGSVIFVDGKSNGTIDGCTISNTVSNSSTQRGLVFCTPGSEVSFSNLHILNSKSYMNVPDISDPFFKGPGAYNYGFVVLGSYGKIVNSSFKNNYCNASLGIALQIVPDRLDEPFIVDECEFINNTCGVASKDSNRTFFKDHGGAMCVSGNSNGSAIIRNCLFKDNVNSQGGAITPHNHCIIDNCRFIHNTATKFYGGAISTEDGIDINNANITIKDCYFEANTAPIGGAIQAKGDYVAILNCTFKDNCAVQGGAVFLEGNNLTLLNSTFTDNNATHSVESEVVIGQNYLPQVSQWNAFGGAVYIHGFNSYLRNNKFYYNSAVKPSNASLSDKGGAIYIYGDNATVIKCYFDDNFAHSGNGSAIYILGVNSTIDKSEFLNHDSGRGTVFIRGSHASILNSLFKANTALNGGAGIYSLGNYSLVDMCEFENNNATVHGGAIHSHGDHIQILNSRFISNNAHPSDNELDNGLGGAIYTKGDFNDIAYCEFNFNTARNGSAIYNRGSELTIEDCDFHYNQAYSYLLTTIASPKFSDYTPDNKILINITHIGGDNIINAIYNDGSYKNIYFYNVTYEHSSVEGKRNSGLTKVNPVSSADESRNGELIYQDSREDLQKINVVVTRERDNGVLGASPMNGEVVSQFNGRTGLYGNISFTLTGDLKPGRYNVYASHLDDKLYKGIDNQTSFEISPYVDLKIMKSSDGDSYFVADTATFTIKIESLGSDAHNVEVREILPEGLEIIYYKVSKGTFNNNIWSIPLINHKTTETLTLKVKLTRAGEFTNRVNVTCSGEDRNLSDNTANKTILVKTFADLTVKKTSNVKTVKIGDKIIWTITVKNTGISNASNVKIKDKLPKGLKYLSYSSSNGEYDSATGLWIVDEVDVNETVTLTITTLALKAGKIINTVSVSSDTDDKNLTDNEAQCSVTVRENQTLKSDNTSSDDGADHKKVLSIKHGKYQTGNPVVLVILALMSICMVTRRK